MLRAAIRVDCVNGVVASVRSRETLPAVIQLQTSMWLVTNWYSTQV